MSSISYQLRELRILITFNHVAISHLPLLLNVARFVIADPVVEMVLWIMLKKIIEKGHGVSVEV